MNSINLQNKMSDIIMNSINSKTSDHHRLLFNLSDKVDLKRSNNYVALSNVALSTTHGKIIANLKRRVNDLTDHILYQIFRIIMSVLSTTLKS